MAPLQHLHERFMAEAIELAREHMLAGHGGPFGAVVIREAEVVGRGWNQVPTLNDPTAHAEIMAIRDASSHLGRFRLDDCVLYTSCEPCPMCLGAAYWARVQAIYFAGTRRDVADAGFDDAAFYCELEKPPALRVVPQRQLLSDAMAKVFEEWKHLPDKVRY